MSRTSLSALLAVIASALVHAPVGEAQVWEVGNVLLELATPQAHAYYGLAMAAGDFDGDGYDDLAIGAPHRDVLGLDDAGQVHILYGSSTGIVTDGQQLLSDDLGGIVLAAHDYFGAALASYNFNEAPWYCVLYPCYEDLAIGIPGQQLAGHQNVGCVKVTYGGPDGIQTIGFDYLDANSANAAPEEGDRFGQKLAAGHSTTPASTTHGDLAVATPYEDYYLTNDGFVHLFFGSNLGVDMDHQEQPLGQYPGFEVAPPEANDYFGTPMVFGDFDGDGHGDLAIGVPYKDSGALDDSGCVQVLYGALFAGGFECGGTSNWTVTRPGRDGNPRRHGACSPASEESLPVDQPGGAGTEEPESRRSGLRRVGG